MARKRGAEISAEQTTQHEQGAPQEQKSRDKASAELRHDIRNHLAAVVNGVQILQQSGTKGPLAEQTLELIERQLKHVIRLVDELLQPMPRLKKAPEATATEEPAAQSTLASPLRLLVVEDNRDVAKSLASMLRLWGHEVSVAYDGLQALRAAEKYPPQIVLLDLELPGLDGIAVARHLKASPKSKAAHLIAVTAAGDEDHRRQVREAGFDFHLVKPVAPAALKQLLASLDGT